MVSADKLSPAEPLKDSHAERDGEAEVAPASKDNPTTAQGEAASLAGVQTFVNNFYRRSPKHMQLVS